MIYNDLYTVESYDKNEVVIILSNENHPIFKAHFPSNPILPGFIHFEIISKVFGLDITGIKKAKFSKVIKPEQTLIYKRDKNKFKVFCKDEEVVSISL